MKNNRFATETVSEHMLEQQHQEPVLHRPAELRPHDVGRSSLWKKIHRSLERDRELPLRQKFDKALAYVRSMMLAHFVLRRCTKVGRRPRTRGTPYVVNYGKIIIGDDFNLSSRIVRSELAAGHKGTIFIGNEVSFNFGALISAQRLVQIGNRVRVGPYSVITDSDFHTPLQRDTPPTGVPTIIEDDVWLGVRVIVLKGSHIGRGAVVAAGSVVSGTIPPYVLAGGSPARVIRPLRRELRPTDHTPVVEETEEFPNFVVKKVEKAFAQTFGSAHAIDFSLGPGRVAGWDSLGHLAFILSLEKEFGIVFSDDDMVHLNTLKEICEAITRRLNGHDTRKEY